MSSPVPAARLAALLVHQGEGPRAVAAVESLRRDWVRTRVGLDLDVAVFDDASPDSAFHLAQLERLGARVLRSPVARGLAAGYQAALGATSGGPADVVLLLDPRAVVLPGTLDALMETVLDPACGLCGPRLVLDPSARLERAAPPPSSPLQLAHRRLRRGGPGRRERLAWTESERAPVDVLAPGCVLLRREVLRRIGLLDPDAPPGWEIADLCLRAAALDLLVVQHSGVAVTLPWAPGEAARARRRDEAEVEWARRVGGFGAAVLLAGARLVAPRRAGGGFVDLGETSEPPAVPFGEERCYALEISPDPGFQVSAGLVDASPGWALPREAWEALPRGPWWARAAEVESGRPLGRWTWRKSAPGRAEARTPAEIAGDLEAAFGSELEPSAALPVRPAASGAPAAADGLSSIPGSGGPTIPAS